MDTTLSVQALDGYVLGKISHRTIPISLTISGNHVENIQFFVLHAPTAPLVLGRPWLHLTLVDPTRIQVHWCGSWAGARRVTPPASAPPHLRPAGLDPRTPLLIYPASPLFITTLHPCLAKTRHSPYPLTVLTIARSISFRGPLFPWGDCTICRSPRRRRCAIISRNPWPPGIIRPSSSPVAAGFFFVAKKDWQPEAMQ